MVNVLKVSIIPPDRSLPTMPGLQDLLCRHPSVKEVLCDGDVSSVMSRGMIYGSGDGRRAGVIQGDLHDV